MFMIGIGLLVLAMIINATVIVLLRNEIRGLENQVRMRDERIDELLEELKK